MLLVDVLARQQKPAKRIDFNGGGDGPGHQLDLLLCTAQGQAQVQTCGDLGQRVLLPKQRRPGSHQGIAPGHRTSGAARHSCSNGAAWMTAVRLGLPPLACQTWLRWRQLPGSAGATPGRVAWPSLCRDRVQCRRDPDSSKGAAQASHWTYKYKQSWIFDDANLWRYDHYDRRCFRFFIVHRHRILIGGYLGFRINIKRTNVYQTARRTGFCYLAAAMAGLPGFL